MKKFYAIAAAGLMALAANAQNGAPLYATGAGFPNGAWAPKTPSEFTYANGEYTLEIKGLTEFKISTTSGEWSEFNAGALTCSYGKEVGAVVSLSPGDANITAPYAGDYTITVAGDLSTIKLTTEAAKPTTAPELYLRGDMNGWGSDAAWKLTPKENVADNTIYSFVCGEGQSISVGEKFKIATDSWTSPNIGGGADPLLALGAEIEVYDGSQANLSVAEKWNGVLYLNLDVDGKIYVALSNDKDFVPEWGNGGDVPTPPVGDYKDLYLVGGFNDWTNPSDLLFTREGNVYTLVLEDGLTGDWKITDGTWDYSFGGGSEVSNAVEADAWFNGGNFSSSFSGKTTIVFTLVAGSDVDKSDIPSKVLVTAEAVAEPDPVEDWYVSVLGDFNKWTADGVHPTTEGVAEIKGLAIGASEFKIKVWDGLADNWYSNGEAIALGTPVVIEGNSDINMTVAGGAEGKVYDVAFNVLTNTLTITEDTQSGVSEMEVAEGAAVYFNLQGMKVENPENGIFVKVMNGKAVKVVK
ncbi:MAG: hypothetical protein K2G23_04135 [Muribaculaceae bacterium]|nr:hypothetical protein [Muribaculaceae bacterium]